MILVAESGSTKTDWRWIGKDGQTRAWKTAGINPFYQTKDTLHSFFHAEVFTEVPTSPVAIFYYGTGITGPDQKELLTSLFQGYWPKTKNIQIESDVVGAGRALFGRGSGLAAILGTGSNSVWFEDGQIAYQIPPLGFWLGDEGSGGHLGKTLVLTYLHHEMPASTRQIFEAQFGAFDRMPILEAAYRKPFPNRYFAQYTPFILAQITDPFIDDLVNQSFTLFFEKYISKYPQNQPLGFVGSIAYYFRNSLDRVAQREGYDIEKIVASPLEDLVTFHLQNL